MIFDHISNAKQYEGLSANFKKAFSYLETLNLAACPEGDFEIDGREVYAFAKPVTLHAPEEVRYEAHRTYADIQLVLNNSEVIYAARTPELDEVTAFDPKGDIAFYADGPHSVKLTLFPGDFAVFFPEDAHKPCCMGESPESFKLVVKVRVG